MRLSSYISQILVRRVDIELLGCPSFHNTVYMDRKHVWVHINSNRAKPRMAGYWKFNTSLLNMKDSWDQLLLITQ